MLTLGDLSKRQGLFKERLCDEPVSGYRGTSGGEGAGQCGSERVIYPGDSVQLEIQSGGEDAGCGAEGTESTLGRAGRQGAGRCPQENAKSFTFEIQSKASNGGTDTENTGGQGKYTKDFLNKKHRSHLNYYCSRETIWQRLLLLQILKKASL